MTPADDLPLPDFDKWWRDNWNMHYSEEFVQRAFNDGALAARAERDALFETQRKTLESQRDELMRKCAERDAEIEKLMRDLRSWEQMRRTEQERAEAAEARIPDLQIAFDLAKQRANEAEARVKELEADNEVLIQAAKEAVEYIQSVDEENFHLKRRASALRARLEAIEKQPTILYGGSLVGLVATQEVIDGWKKVEPGCVELIERPKPESNR